MFFFPFLPRRTCEKDLALYEQFIDKISSWLESSAGRPFYYKKFVVLVDIATVFILCLIVLRRITRCSFPQKYHDFYCSLVDYLFFSPLSRLFFPAMISHTKKRFYFFSQRLHMWNLTEESKKYMFLPGLWLQEMVKEYFCKVRFSWYFCWFVFCSFLYLSLFMELVIWYPFSYFFA